MSEGALGLIRRVTIDSESTIYTADANPENIAGVENLTFTHMRESLEDQRHLTLAKGQYASHLGRKSGEISFTTPVHASTYSEMAFPLKSAFGTQSTNTITYASANTTTLTKSAGNFDPITLVTVGGVEIPIPSKSVSTNTLTYAILPGGSASAAVNASQSSGACFVQDYTASAYTMSMLIDADGESDFVPYEYSGCVTNKCELNLDLNQRLSLNFGFMAGDWTTTTTISASDPSALSKQFLGYAANCYLQDIGTPAAGTQIDLHSLNVNLCWDWVPRAAVRANTSNAIPGSPICGYKPRLWCPDGVKMTLTKNASAYMTARTNKTPYGFFMVFNVGGPGDTASTNNKVALWIPRLVLDADPVEVDIDGLTGVELSFKVELESTLSSEVSTQAALAFFN